MEEEKIDELVLAKLPATGASVRYLRKEMEKSQIRPGKLKKSLKRLEEKGKVVRKKTGGDYLANGVPRYFPVR